MSLAAANGRWTDSDFGYDPDFDFLGEAGQIRRPDGLILYPVSTFNSKAEFAVHFCTNAREIWAFEVQKLRRQVQLDRMQRCYCPRYKDKGYPTAAGFLLPVSLVAEFGHCWQMPETTADRLLATKNKTQSGLTAERQFFDLVKGGFFLPVLSIPVVKACKSDDIGGVDFFVSGGLAVQVKEDRPGGRGGTGHLFMQSHTVAAREAHKWFEYERRPEVVCQE